MSNPLQTFKKTGKNVTVSRDNLINATLDRLQEYDSFNDVQRSKEPNPYSDPITVILENGKMVQVPRYVQNAAIVRWKSNKLSPHTRMDRRKRYADHDPYIMNRNLRNIKGAREDFENNDLIDRNLKRQSIDTMQRQMAVGQARIPDDRYGRGGTYGDLPRDFEIFGTKINRDVDDTTYMSDKNSLDRINPIGYYDFYDPNYFKTQNTYDTSSKDRVRDGFKNRRDERSDMNRRDERSDMTCNPNSLMVSDSLLVSGPANMVPFGRSVSPNESDINSESTTGEMNVVENYALIDDEELDPDLDNNTYNYNPDNSEYKEYDIDYDETNYQSNKNAIPNSENDNRYDNPYDNNNDYVKETIENMDGTTDSTYKYLFFILLIIIIIFFFFGYNYKR